MQEKETLATWVYREQKWKHDKGSNTTTFHYPNFIKLLSPKVRFGWLMNASLHNLTLVSGKNYLVLCNF